MNAITSPNLPGPTYISVVANALFSRCFKSIHQQLKKINCPEKFPIERDSKSVEPKLYQTLLKSGPGINVCTPTFSAETEHLQIELDYDISLFRRVISLSVGTTRQVFDCAQVPTPFTSVTKSGTFL